MTENYNPRPQDIRDGDLVCVSMRGRGGDWMRTNQGLLYAFPARWLRPDDDARICDARNKHPSPGNWMPDVCWPLADALEQSGETEDSFHSEGLPSHLWTGPNGFRVWRRDELWYEYQPFDFDAQYIGDRAGTLRDRRGAGRLLTHPFLFSTFQRVARLYRDIERIEGERLWVPDIVRSEWFDLAVASIGSPDPSAALLASLWKKIDRMHATSRSYFEKHWWRLYAWHHFDMMTQTAAWSPSSGAEASGNFYLTYFHIWQFAQVCDLREKFVPVPQPMNEKILQERHPHVLLGAGDWPRRLTDIGLRPVQLTRSHPRGMTPEQCGINTVLLYQIPIAA